MAMTTIITFCSLLLIAYLFDLTSSKTRIPSVILLLLLGWVVRQIADFMDFRLAYFSSILPIFGTIGLILIVLEGALELELNKTKTGLIKNSLAGAFISMILSAFVFAWLFQYYGQYSFKDSLINAVPLSIISSAIAIPSVRNLALPHREFVIYESSLSDILGVLFFNFITLHETFNISSFGHFGFQIIVISVVSFIATIGLSLLLSRIEHHIKYIPIILLIILFYAVSKVYHLPGLIFILMFGLFIGNFDELKHLKWTQRFRPVELNKEVQKFKELTIEGAFLVRSLFFILFGFLLETSEIINTETLVWSVSIVIIIYVFRAIQLKLSKLPINPLLFVAPRGLITILLFLSIEPIHQIPLVNRSLIVQVILLSSVMMIIGLVLSRKNDINKQI